MSKIGVFAGSFDPVHAGHVAFALAAANLAKLDKVYFLIESQPRYKSGVTHLAHRLAMLKLALKHHPVLEVLDFPDRQFSVAKTLPRLNHKFPDDELFLVCGSDVLEHMADWPLVDSLLKSMRLIIGLRHDSKRAAVGPWLDKLPGDQEPALVMTSPLPKLSSRSIRESLLNDNKASGLDQAVAEYIKTNWLYASPSNSISAS